jgi:type III secretion system YscD/HrpQ family protein
MNAKLIAQEGSLRGKTFLLSQENEWFIGRDPDLSTIVVEDPKASRQHALLTKSDEGIIIENLSSTNPISINNQQTLVPTLLKEGDLIKIGSTLFLFSLSQEDDSNNIENGSVVKENLELLEDNLGDNNPTVIEEPFIETNEADGLLNFPIDLNIRERFLVKIIAGPQVGSEFSMTPEKTYTIGSDASLSDIILYDLSVSRKHAEIKVLQDMTCQILDLDSRNGVFINGSRIDKKSIIKSQDIIQLGTTSFILIDRESESHTIIAQSPIKPKEEIVAVEAEEAKKEQIKEENNEEIKEKIINEKNESFFTKGYLIFGSIIALILFLLFLALSSLFEVKEEIKPEKDIQGELSAIITPFNDVNFTYNKTTGTLFLVGHVLTPIEKRQLEYNLKGLNFITQLDDTNVVVDQYLWQEMNNLISKNPSWSGVAMHAAKPGVFVITGYLKTRAESTNLQDFLNLNFPYLDRLQNKVSVEEDLIARFNSNLLSQSMNGVNVQMSNGEVILSGFIASDKELNLQDMIKVWKTLPGIRLIKNFTVPLSPQEAVIDISSKFQVTGFSTRDHANINVVINGRILTRGDMLEGMTITSIQSNKVYLEKDGLKFKIEYNS